MKRLEYKKTSNPKRRSASAVDAKKKKSANVKSNIEYDKNMNIKYNNKSNLNEKKSMKKDNYKNSKKIKKNKKKNIILATFIIIAILILSCYLIFSLSAFDIKNIEVLGTSIYTNEEVIQKSNVKIGGNIFWQFLKGISKDINSMPYIKSAKIKIQLPDKVTIEVTQRTSKYFSFDKDKNKYYRIDDEGVILEEANIKDKIADEILVYGFIFDDEVTFATKLKDIDIDKIKVYENVDKEFKKSGINGSITKVNFENSLTTITINDKLNVVLPNDNDIKYNINFLKQIIAKIGEDSVGIIDMTKSNPTFSSFK